MIRHERFPQQIFDTHLREVDGIARRTCRAAPRSTACCSKVARTAATIVGRRRSASPAAARCSAVPTTRTSTCAPAYGVEPTRRTDEHVVGIEVVVGLERFTRVAQRQGRVEEPPSEQRQVRVEREDARPSPRPRQPS